MANYDQRVPLDYRYGQLSGGVDSLATALTSPEFATLPSDLSSTRYVPIVLADDSLKLFEIVWITGHASSSQSVTVVRGREGSTARAWGAGTIWRMAPTARDLIVPVANRAALPSDAHLGMRALVLDEGVVVVKAATGWASSIKHGWSQSSGPVANNSLTTVSGLTPRSDNPNPGIATLNGGVLLLNRPGQWALTYKALSSHDPSDGISQIALDWPGGAFQTSDNKLLDQRPRLTGFAAAGVVHQLLHWSGFVPAAAAALPITVTVYQTLRTPATINYGYEIYAEFRG